jgi:PAS domain S-box-containing protein
MSANRQDPQRSERLRERAERLLREQEANGSDDFDEVRDLVHELAVHQMELDMQNEELRGSQLELNRSRDRYQLLFDSAPIGYLALDAKGVIREANDAAASLLGAERGRAAGKPLIALLPGREHGNFFTLLQRVFAEGEAARDMELRPRDGALRTIRLTASLARESLGDEARCLCAMQDISFRVEAERALRQALKEAETANRAKSVFLANMSHEIRTPLNGVLGILQLLSRTAQEPRNKELIEVGLNAGQGLLSVLNDVLEFSRIEAGRIEVQDQPFVLRDLFSMLLRLFLPQTATKGINLVMDLAPDSPDVLSGDSGLLRQILFNVIGNAVKFTQKGEVRVWAGPLPSRGAGRCRMLFMVEDSGIGMADNDLTSIFDEFHQVERHYNRRFGGVGLGLAIVRRLVSRMGGTLAYESERGKGTRAWISLPFGAPSLEGASSVPKGEVECGERGRVLVVEDDDVARKVICRILEEWGYGFAVAEDGHMALDLLEREEFDCVLMDIRMPGMDGEECTRRIRNADRSYSSIPIAVMTAFAYTEERDKILRAGMDAYLAKPLDMEELQKVLTELVSRSCRPAL